MLNFYILKIIIIAITIMEQLNHLGKSWKRNKKIILHFKCWICIIFKKDFTIFYPQYRWIHFHSSGWKLLLLNLIKYFVHCDKWSIINIKLCCQSEFLQTKNEKLYWWTWNLRSHHCYVLIYIGFIVHSE